MVPDNSYDHRYAGDDLYWGKQPSELCDRLLEVCKPGKTPLRLIDLGAGEGRNAVYLARSGFQVTALDLSPQGIRKAEQMAADAGVELDTEVADIREHTLQSTYDVVFSTGTLHYLPPEQRRERIEHFKSMTAASGLHAITVLVQKPFIAAAPDAEPGIILFKSGELLSYYWDWEILFSFEGIFDCRSSGIPHRHAVNRMIARRR